MFIVAIGVNHKTAPVEVREKVAYVGDQLPKALSTLGEAVPAGAILSTCNRTEVYALYEQVAPGLRRLEEFLSQCRGVALEELSPYLYRFSGQEAVTHLFEVAAGIDSLIVGEPQILGQVRVALQEGEAAGALKAPLTNLFHQALRVGRRAREETGIARNAISVSSAAVELARKFFGELGSCKVLVISTGDMGKLAIMSLVGQGVGEVLVTNRTFDSASRLAQAIGGRAIPFTEMGQALMECDIVISATGAPHYILETQPVEIAMKRRRGRPLLLIDIALPRDVNPQVRAIPDVHLFDLDDLKAVGEANLEGRREEVDRVKALIEGETEKFTTWWQTLEVVPTIRDLRHQAEAVRQEEVERALRKLAHLSVADAAVIEAMSRAIIKKLLHAPISDLKAHTDGNGKLALVRDLFRLDELASGRVGAGAEKKERD